MENQLFSYESWDGDDKIMTFWKVTLNCQIGSFAPGTQFSEATILWQDGKLQLGNFGESYVNEDGIEVITILGYWEFKLRLETDQIN